MGYCRGFGRYGRTSSCGSANNELTDRRLRSGGSRVICDDANGGNVEVDLAEFREVCSSEAIEEPGVRGVLAKGL
jgi:hypothetical protein